MNLGKYFNTPYDDNSAFHGPHNTFDQLVGLRLLDFTILPPKSKSCMYFKKIDKFITHCKICFQNIKYCGNTSNLTKHLKKHVNVLEPGKVVQQLKLLLNS